MSYKRIRDNRYCNRNKEYMRSYHKARQALIKDQVWKLKKDTPCFDCGKHYDPWVMQFDHRDPEIKSFDVARSHSYEWNKVLAEIAKCDIVCANCHASRTQDRRGDSRIIKDIESPQLTFFQIPSHTLV